MSGSPEVLAGLVLGLAGSAHCAVMCGPLTLAVRHPRRLALYHAGRLAAYMAAGVVAGLAGAEARAMGGGRLVALAVGLGLLAVAASFAGTSRTSWLGRRLAPIFGRLARAAAALTDRHPVAGGLAAGTVNACLPCGLLYAALPAAAALGTVMAASTFMFLFGLGTLPALAGVWLVAGRAVPAVGRRLRHATPIAIGLLGLLVLLRGLVPPAHAGHAPAERPPHHAHHAS